MADHQQANVLGEPSASNQTASTAATGSQMDDRLLQHETVKKITELFDKEKCAVLVEFCNLSTHNLKLEKSILFLQKSLMKVMEEKDAIQLNLISQDKFQPVLQASEERRKKALNKLVVEFESVNSQIKTIDKVRLQFNNDVVNQRSSMEVLIKRISALEEKAKEYSGNMERWNKCKADMQERIDQLQIENDVFVTAQNEAESLLKEREAEKATLSNELTRVTQEQQRERLTNVELNNEFSKIRGENDQLKQEIEQLKQSKEAMLSSMQQNANIMAQQYDEKLLACDSSIHTLEEKVQKLENDNVGLQETNSKLTDAINQSHNRIKELEAQITNQRKKRPSKGNAYLGGIVNPNTGIKKDSRNNTKPVPTNNLNLMESFHYDNELSLMMSSPFCDQGPHDE